MDKQPLPALFLKMPEVTPCRNYLSKYLLLSSFSSVSFALPWQPELMALMLPYRHISSIFNFFPELILKQRQILNPAQILKPFKKVVHTRKKER